ncbi:MAG: D-alanine--D-alanine ligase [gamma proteobacterium symbiont of Bathyaustriella thionipta]|nr:D-alanine--D-alanine ligase [gamma proteobacterium symbiont of Bathyaustriella thionipta]MCU7949310.1 D-alanine--D-alanine ligase [gamma proteobacterium symbiont of Bathyaustriella thionipta]MCU7953386.1 D-alanine--D-alanine ligase [gamma proteobacterium symbiont of Bathyaustriella thionipta]MCU7955905.1 D-alanine--D-alanine ligase [gamma proteobacterium symbiont of Bathyaustriella thionipta]MCU7968303.1 D-alanine--D-alanine ligase [gamma proteobacterium symbiont of Bathyaustriella thionipta
MLKKGNKQTDFIEAVSIKPEALGRVAVLMGGDSAEREVSLKSGQAALNALIRKGVDAFGLDLRFNKRGEHGSVCQQLTSEKIDIAFIALHGRGGEDGVVQGVLEALGITYTGCHVAASAIGMDKLRTKLLWSGRGLPTPAFELVKAAMVLSEDKNTVNLLLEQVAGALGFPVMVKPAHEGSSIGMNKADDKDSLLNALKSAASYDDEILVEKWIVGKEYTGAVLAGQALPLIRLETPRDFYDFHAKYVSDDTLYHCPCGLDDELEKKYQTLILDAFDCIGATGWGRVDFMCDERGKFWLIEINTVPGLTDHSLVPMAAKHYGIEFDDLIFQILATAVNHGE